MTTRSGNQARKEIALIVVGPLFVMSGFGGIILGGTSAEAGWWCVVVGTILGLAGLAARLPRRLV